MPTVAFISGLCGSGKSWLADQIRSEGYEVLDEGFPATVDGSLSREKYAKLQDLLRDGKHCAVVEATLYYAPLREQAKTYLHGIPNVEVKWEFFENDLASGFLETMAIRASQVRRT